MDEQVTRMKQTRARRRGDTPTRRRLRHARRRVGSWLMPHVAPATLIALSRTWKVQRHYVEHLEAVRLAHGSLLTMWHGRMILPLPTHRDQGMHVLVSPSDDGSLVHSLLGRFGYHTIRGSTNKRPVPAVRRMLAELERGTTVVLTPDGPRGPRHSMNLGPAWMARATGFPILPLGCVTDRAWYMEKAWDRFTIPRPRARIVLLYGEPVHVEPDADDETVQRKADELRETMIGLETEGFRRLGREPDW